MEMRHEVVFGGEVGLFRMFNVECDVARKGDNGMSPIRKPLWGVVKRKLTRGEKAALQSDDHAIVKMGKPGSQERIDSYAAAVANGGMMFDDSYADTVDENDD